MSHNLGELRPYEREAIQELRRLQNPAYRHKRHLTDPELYRRELSRLKRMIMGRQADAEPHHDHNSALRTFSPQLTGHKGKCKLNRARSMGRFSNWK